MTDEVCFFDCIEFNERFRCGDVASEVAFLAMDLDARGRPDLGFYFSERYQARTADEQLFALLPFYRCYRAYVRGKVLSFRLTEPEFGAEEKEAALLRAQHYFELARRYASRLGQPTVIVVAGLSGTGKTSVARAVAGELGLRVVSADVVRQSLFGEAKRPAGYGRGAYTAEANLRTYEALVETGHDLLRRDGGVILDATFRRAADRELARAMAAHAGAQWRLIECQLAPELVEARLNERLARKDGLSDATWETYLQQREEFESIADSSAFTHLVLDTSASLHAGGQAVTDWLRGNDRRQGGATAATSSEYQESET
jgi:predicted kinase